MTFLIAVDLEGMACVVGEPGKSLSRSRDYAFACEQAAREANALARGLFDGGAQGVVLWDNHNGSLNLRYEDLDPRIAVLCGTGGTHRMDFLPDLAVDALVLLGYHGRAGAPASVLAHTYSSVLYQDVRLNGESVGEITLDALLAAERGVPLAMVAGDDTLAGEIKAVQPGCRHVVTKRALGRNFSLSRSAMGICDDLHAAGLATARAEKPPVCRLPDSVRLTFRYQRSEDAERRVRSDPRYAAVDAYTVEASATALSELL